MKKAMVFSMDTAYAIFIVLLTSTTIVALVNDSTQTNYSSLYLSRIARDFHDVNQSMNGNLDPTDIEWASVNSCVRSDTIGSHRAVVYAGNGEVRTVKVEVCLNE